ncbi:MAG: branched-chain amino acid transaminase [Bacteroidetes bacterium]|nr:branched-chain amino acid transaminase [Bacteroidota bacterium]
MYYNEKTIIYRDGAFVKAAESSIDLYSQTLHYGYGVFEGIRTYPTEKGTRIFKAKEHYDRLKRSAELINIPFNYNVDDLIKQTYELLEKNNMTNAYIRPLVFCSPNMTLSKPNASSDVHIMICAWEWGAYLGDKMLNLMISSFCRPHPRSVKVEAKACGHYVNSILATNEAKAAGYDEALLLDYNGFLAEGPGANLFFQKDGQLFTTQLGNILAGITRATVIEIANDLGIKVTEGLFKPEELLTADSAFYCGTAAEVAPIASVNKQVFKTAWKDSLGKQIQEAYQCKVLEKQYALSK